MLERHEWSVTTFDEETLERMRGYLDHDDPVAWERVWTPPPKSALDIVRPRSTRCHPVADDAVARGAGRHTDRDTRR